MSDFQVMPPLDAATEAALATSIKRFGVLVPVVRDQYGRIIDGHHRARIADSLGVPYRVDVVEVADDDEARHVATTLNTDRRQLTVEQRREVVAALREQGHSLRAIAGAVGVSAKTVHADLSDPGVTQVTPAERDLTGADYTAPAERIVGLDGKSYPATRPADSRLPNAGSAEAIVAEAAENDLHIRRVKAMHLFTTATAAVAALWPKEEAIVDALAHNGNPRYIDSLERSIGHLERIRDRLRPQGLRRVK